MRWTDDLFLETAKASGNHRRATLQLGMYAQHLGSANGLLCKTLKVDTIKRYIQNVSDFFTNFGTPRVDFRYDTQGDKTFSPVLTSVYKELARWESVPNRREAFTLAMLDALRERITKTKPHFHSLICALADQFEIGLFNGQCWAEFAQTPATSDPDHPQLNIAGDAQAFCLNDTRVVTADGRSLVGAAMLQVPVEQCSTGFVRWRFQKNGDNGQELMWAVASLDDDYSLVVPLYNVVRRFVALRGAADITTPLALYATTRKHKPVVRLITDRDIEGLMRSLACEVYKFHPVKDKAILSKWSAHSLRVGAAVLLHAMDFTGEQIKFILRWRSNAFMVYLRSNIILANKQVRALNEASKLMPNPC